MKEVGGTWDYETLSQFISDPAVLVPGTNMIFPGLQDEDQRVELIAYLRSLSIIRCPYHFSSNLEA